ncbi:HET-domain-containing protein [Lepidopterella palustris CBS 459.81]|uniref:HET-domain-containing protein n=1 Tax=Lepidopterella palustris CBS 459.81 TaxID=1314670 RepID=A0A8E2J9E6_9PEZI|nr:HET-domain-containing protein [Lepidopterella palustris CBS 459.81]
MHHYQYTPLANHHSIRVIELLKGQAKDPVFCRVHHVDLAHNTIYNTLSYTWENELPTIPISCDEHELLVTPNLHAALLRLRHHSRNLTIWVDAICINQYDIEERSSQVQLMRKIYQCGRQLLIWLGEEDPGTATAARVIRRLDEMVKKGLRISDDITRDNSHLLMNLGLPNIDSADWVAFRKFFDRRWFQRVWILQEVAMGCQLSVPLVRCGSHTLTWNQIQNAANWTNRSNGDSLSRVTESGSKIYLTTDIQSFVTWTSRHTGLQKATLLSDALSTSRPFGAKLEHDKVYALYGFLMSDLDALEDAALIPDYSKSFSDVYRDTARYIISQQKSLDLLGMVEDKEMQKLSNLPSWVPDWREMHLPIPFSDRSRRAGFDAAKGTPVAAGRLQDQSALKANAIFVDRVRYASQHQYAFDAYWRTLSSNAYSRMRSTDSACRSFLFYWARVQIPYIFNKQKMSEYFNELTTDDARISFFITLYAFTKLLQDAFPDGSNPTQTFLKFKERNRTGGPDLHRTFMKSLYNAWQKRFFITKRGFMGLGPRGIKPGDLIYILAGGQVPYVLRKLYHQHFLRGSEASPHYQLVGECYVHGIMYGEWVAMEGARSRGNLWEAINLV